MDEWRADLPDKLDPTQTDKERAK
eukprot:SAG22_NODE_22758_length_189_cov_19.288889_2_plen_23_part_01